VIAVIKKILSVVVPVILLTASAGVFVVNHYCLMTGKTTLGHACCNSCDEQCCKKELKVFRFTFESVKQPDTKWIFTSPSCPSLISTENSLLSQALSFWLYWHPPCISPLKQKVRTVVLRI
jgi:hypothetical protein